MGNGLPTHRANSPRAETKVHESAYCIVIERIGTSLVHLMHYIQTDRQTDKHRVNGTLVVSDHHTWNRHTSTSMSLDAILWKAYDAGRS